MAKKLEVFAHDGEINLAAQICMRVIRSTSYVNEKAFARTLRTSRPLSRGTGQNNDIFVCIDLREIVRFIHVYFEINTYPSTRTTNQLKC